MPCCRSLALRLFCFVLFRFRIFAFTEAAALRSIVSSMCMRPDSHTQLPSNCLRPFLFSFIHLFLFFGDVAFSDYFCTILPFSPCTESTSYPWYVFSSGWYFSTLETTVWIFYVSSEPVLSSRFFSKTIEHIPRNDEGNSRLLFSSKTVFSKF